MSSSDQNTDAESVESAPLPVPVPLSSPIPEPVMDYPVPSPVEPVAPAETEVEAEETADEEVVTDAEPSTDEGDQAEEAEVVAVEEPVSTESDDSLFALYTDDDKTAGDIVDVMERDGLEVRITSDSGASKGSKLARYDLIPVEALRLLAEHYGKGAEKYEPVTKTITITNPDTGETREVEVTRDNWRWGYPVSLSFAAMQRHAWQFWSGEDCDEETGSSHLTAVAWHAFTMLTFMLDEDLRTKYDDRPAWPRH